MPMSRHLPERPGDRKRLLFTGKLLFSSGLLACLFWKFPLPHALAVLRETRPLPLAAAVLILLPMSFLGGWQILYMTRIQGILLSLRDIIRINLATNFYSLLLPGVVAGGAVKWYKFAKEGKKPAQAAAVILFNRFLETFSVVLVGVLCFLPDPANGQLRPLQTAAPLLLAAFLLGYILLLVPRLPARLAHWCRRLPLPEPARDKCGKLLESMERFHHFRLGDHLGLHAILLVKNSLGILSVFWLARALDLEVTFLQIAWIRSVVMLLAMLPVTFAGLGLREGALVMLLHGYGVSPAEALALSFLIFLRGILPAAAGGLLELRSLLRPPAPMVEPDRQGAAAGRE